MDDPVLSFYPQAFGTAEHLKLNKSVFNSTCPMFRKEFFIDIPVKSATAYVCGLGFFELTLNGQRVDDRVLMPPKTDYSHHVRYETFYITDQIKKGGNCIGVILGNGWYNTNPDFWGWQFQWYGRVRLIFELDIEYENGSRETISSDSSWKCHTSPIQKSCIYTGEQYDARLEQPNWNRVNFDDSSWQPSSVVCAPWDGRDRHCGAHFLPADNIISRVCKIIKPLNIREVQPGIFVFDFGVNFSGWVRLKIQAAPCGSSVRMKYAENIDDKTGMIDVTSVHIISCDTYIAKGDNIEIWEPRFVWHGFRYVEVAGLPGKPDLDILEGHFVHNDVSQRGKFSCDDKFINHLHDCILRGQLSNLQCGVPIDCPQRDERLGWLGDAHVTCEEAGLNFDMYDFYRKWMTDIRAQQDSQGRISIIAPRPGIEIPGDVVWSSAVFIVPWEVWQETGRVDILIENYECMKLYFEYIKGQSDNYILPGGKYGDHLSVDKHFRYHAGLPVSIYTAFFFRNADICSKISAVLGKDDEARYFRQLKERIRNAFNERFLKDGKYDNGSQTAFALPLAFGMVLPSELEEVSRAFVERIEKDGYHPTTGIVGTKYLAMALDTIGRSDIFWKMLHVDGMPGWKHLLQNQKTTLPEQWDQSGSGNHIVFGSIDYWFFRTLAGIQRCEDSPGYKRVHFSPFFPEMLNNVSASIKTSFGEISISWQRNEKNYKISLVVPKDVKYTLNIPDDAEVTIVKFKE